MEKRFRKPILILLCLLSIQVWAQEREVSGEVFDTDGMPLPGVNVFVENTSIGTVTDFDGQFSLSIPDDDSTVLVFSSLGFQEQKVTIENQENFSITMQPNTEGLDEVVVVGYGSQKRSNVTSAISTVDAEVLDSRPITDVARGLQGASPGVTITAPTGQIGQNPTIRLRGNVGTLSPGGGGAQPLILVDNVEVSSLQSINPQDIENISILKDAASTSIYGARAAWGVILITTKNGRRNQAPTVNYSNNISWSTPTTTPTVAPAAEGAEMAFAAVRRRIPSLDAFGLVNMFLDDTAIERMRDWEEQYGDQNLSDEMVLGRDFEIRDGRLFFYRPWNPEKMFVKEWAPQQKHDLSVSGGSEKTNYYVGLGYLEQGGVYKTNPDEFERYNLNLSVNTSITDWMDVRSKVLYTNTRTTEPFAFGSATYDAWYYTTRWPAYYPYGTYEGNPFRSHINEVTQANMNENNRSLTRINLGTTINPIENLDINFDYTYDEVNNHEHQVGGSVSAYNFWATGPNLVYEPYTSPAYDRVQYNSSWSRRNTAKAFATYDLNIADDHQFEVTLGGDAEEFELWAQTSQRRDLLNPEQGELDLATGDQFVTGDRENWTTLGAFARINYSYKEKYLLNLNGRYDGSSRLSPNEKWAFFPSMSAGWIVSQEDFMDAVKPTLSFFKIRGSYGSVGNQNARISNIYRTMASSDSDWLIGGVNQLTVGTPGAFPASLTWETVTTLDLGFDARFFQDKLGASFSWYERTISDMHSSGVTLPNTFGTSAPVRNFGEIQTRGWELEIDFNHTFDNGLSINAKGNLTDFREKVTKYANTTQRLPDPIAALNDDDQYNEGTYLGDIWGYETDRFFTEDDFDSEGNLVEGIPSQEIFETNGWFQYGPGDIKYKDLNGDGVIDFGSRTLDDSGDMKKIGNSTPRYQYGIQLGANWKGFDFNMFMQGVGKRDFWANGPVFIPGYRYGEAWYEHQLDYWTPENTNAYYPRPNDQQQANDQMNFLPQTKYLLDMSYLRMKNITLGYTIPNTLTEKFQVERFRIYASGENLFEFTGADIPVDPEVDYTTSGLNDTSTFGRVYPFRRAFSVGVQVTL